LIVAELHRRGFLNTLQVQQVYSGAVRLCNEINYPKKSFVGRYLMS
jgi:hypothetical protein